MNPQILGILAALGAVAFVFYLLRRGVLPERFAALWILVSGGLLVLALFPRLLGWLARITGVQVPLNLLLFVAAVVLLLVSVQLSFEVGRLEARTRRLAEEIALLTYRFDSRGAAEAGATQEPSGDGTGVSNVRATDHDAGSGRAEEIPGSTRPGGPAESGTTGHEG